MHNTEWVRRMLFSGGLGRQNIVAATLIGWLVMFAVVAKMFLGCSAEFRQGVAPFQGQFYKIGESSSDSAEPSEIIVLPTALAGELSFLACGVSTDDLSSGIFTGSDQDVSALAMIGVAVSAAPVNRIDRAASPSRSVLFHPIIDRAAAQYQVDPALVRAIIFAESGYNPAAVSKRGAMGLMQLMPGTAKAMGVEDCFDPEHNIYGGVKYFKKLINQFGGDVKLALAAYNAGSRKVREFNGVPPFRATERYIQKVLKYYKIYKVQQPEPVGLS